MTFLTKSFAYFFGASFVGTATQLAKGKISAVFLGAEGVGVLSQLTAMWGLVHAGANLGLYGGVVRHIAAHHGKNNNQRRDRHFSSVFWFLLAISLIATIAGAVGASTISQLLFGDNGARAGLVALILLGIPLGVIAQTYRALLVGIGAVEKLVKARVLSDISSVFVFAAMVYVFDLQGAVIAFVALQLMLLIAFAAAALVSAGRSAAIPKINLVSLREITPNFRHGVTGLTVTCASILAFVIVSRWIIEHQGLEANGIFAVAWKVATVYLGGLHATSGGAYYPSLVRCETPLEMSEEINQALSLYMYTIPPVMIALIVGGEFLISAFFSYEFIAAATLLLVFLPADLLRIMSETLGLALLARDRFAFYVGLHILWATCFLAFAGLALPDYGLTGVATAYLLAYAVTAAGAVVGVRNGLKFRFTRQSANALMRAVVVVSGSALLVGLTDSRLSSGLACVGLLSLWFALSLWDKEFRRIVQNARNTLMGIA